VRALVEALSDDKSLPRPRRRAITLEELPSMDALVKVIKLADLSSNIKLLPHTWSEERKLEYLEWSERAATICSAECAPLAAVYWQRAGATRAALESSRRA
jgi:guanosine-3',5'-bis(diphosphate) 3'-pyrophosphohydrolase